MKKTVFICSVLLFFYGSLSAQRFGHINMNQIIDLMPEKDSAEAKLQSYYKELLDELEVMQVEYNKKLQDYTAKQANFTDLIRQNKEEELRSLQQRIQQFQQQADQSFQQKQIELLNGVIEIVKKTIAEIAKEQKLLYVFNVGGLNSSVDAVLYYSEESIDIGPMVMKKLNLKPKPSTTSPSAPQNQKK